jgi:Ca2+-binding RTX toxin-like protein
VELSAIAGGSGGFVINGQSADDQSGDSVSSAGDVNGDGLADLIVGVSGNDGVATNAGRSYVVFGKADTAEVNLADVATGGSGARAIAYSGTTADDTWSGTTNAEIILGGSGNDTLTGNGGADVLYGGAGNDTLVINTSNATALATGYTDLLARVDGGLGFDTLRLSGASIDLTLIANQAAGDSETGSRIAGIERIDLATDTNANTLTLSVKDVLDLSGMNQIHLGLSEDGNTWSNSTNSPLTDTVAKHQLVITGDGSDQVVLSDQASWTSAGTVSDGTGATAHTYDVYNHNASAAQILVDHLLVQAHPVL